MGEFKRPCTPSSGLDEQNTLQVLGIEGSDVLRSISPGRMSIDSQDSCHTEDAAEKGFLDIHVRQAVRRSNSSVAAGMPVYPMISNPRGMALVIDIRKYDNDVQDERYGSEVIYVCVFNIIRFSYSIILFLNIKMFFWYWSILGW